jgi:hypothetical protein
MVGMPAACSRSMAAVTSERSRTPADHRMLALAPAEYLRKAHEQQSQSTHSGQDASILKQCSLSLPLVKDVWPMALMSWLDGMMMMMMMMMMVVVVVVTQQSAGAIPQQIAQAATTAKEQQSMEDIKQVCSTTMCSEHGSLSCYSSTEL